MFEIFISFVLLSPGQHAALLHALRDFSWQGLYDCSDPGQMFDEFYRILNGLLDSAKQDGRL